MELLITHCVNNLWDSWPQMVRKCTTCWASSYTSSIGTSFSTTISTSSRGFMQKAQMSTGQLKAHSHNWWASSRMSKNFKSLKTWESSASPSGFFKTVVLSTWLKVKFFDIKGPVFSSAPAYHPMVIHTEKVGSNPYSGGDFLRFYSSENCPKQN